MPSIDESVRVLVDLKQDITNECQILQNLMDEYALPTGAVAILERVMANLDELANGTGQ